MKREGRLSSAWQFEFQKKTQVEFNEGVVILALFVLSFIFEFIQCNNFYEVRLIAAAEKACSIWFMVRTYEKKSWSASPQ